MGTNFYWKERPGGDHIGKRSAAGWFCWDCGITLSKAGPAGVHRGDTQWHNSCPQCGQHIPSEKLDEGSAGRELGFNKSKPRRKIGVASCSSFTWGMQPAILLQRLVRTRTGKPIYDEYGRRYSPREFAAVLSECPLQYFGMIGEEFS